MVVRSRDSPLRRHHSRCHMKPQHHRWLYQGRVSHSSGFFHSVTSDKLLLCLKFYGTSWKIFEILQLFHISKLEAQLDGQESQAPDQTSE